MTFEHDMIDDFTKLDEKVRYLETIPIYVDKYNIWILGIFFGI